MVGNVSARVGLRRVGASRYQARHRRRHLGRARLTHAQHATVAFLQVKVRLDKRFRIRLGGRDAVLRPDRAAGACQQNHYQQSKPNVFELHRFPSYLVLKKL
jgi:hypothetical protein